MPTPSRSPGNIRGTSPPDIRYSREPSDVMSELVADFFRHSTYSSQKLLCRNLAHVCGVCKEGYASIHGDGRKTAAIRSDPASSVRLWTCSAIPHSLREQSQHAAMDRQTIARGKYHTKEVGRSVCPGVFRLSVDDAPRHAVAIMGQAPLSAVQEPNFTTKPNGDSLCSD
jgi:hypothetical protein